MYTIEQKMQLLSEKINELTEQYDQDFRELLECDVSEELLTSLIENALVAEIEKIISLFEAFNPNVFIQGITRKYSEEGDPIVYLDWLKKEK